jgi:hypothetical protein
MKLLLATVLLGLFGISSCGHAATDKSNSTHEKNTPVNISLTANKTELSASDDTETLYFYAVVECGDSSMRVNLLDSDNNVVAQMTDNGKHNITGDIQANLTFTAKLDVNPSVTSTYHAQIEGENVKSNEVTIHIVTPFNSQDFADMDTVKAEIQTLRENDEYSQMNLEERAKAFLGLLTNLAQRGLIIEDSIVYEESSDVISYKHSSGLISSIKLVDPNPDYN